MTLQEQAVEYAAHGWRLVPLGPDKRPVRAKWNTRARVVDSVEEASGLRSAGVGLAHAYSGTCCIDVDDNEAAEAWCKAQGLGSDYLYRQRCAQGAVIILSPVPGRFKLLFRAPSVLRTWVPVKGLEFRCAAGSGLTVQDVLPPSPHPKGGVYQWIGDWRNLPELPAEVAALWLARGDGANVHQDGAPAEDYPAPLGLEIDEIEAVLRKIDPDVSYPEWIKVGQALQHERPDDGLALWEWWSAGGSKYPGAELLAEKWASFGHAAKPVTMRSIVRDYASAADPDEFEVIEDTRKPAIAAGFVRFQDLVAMPLQNWIIRGLLPEAELGVIYGPSGAGKSFVALDLAMTIARGRAWNGQRVSDGRVVYVAAEGFGGMVARGKAYAKVHEVEDVPALLLYKHPLPLMGDAWKPFADTVQELGGANVIVFDTLARCMPGDENASQDMAAVIANCGRLHRATGALILLVHHTGKDVDRGARGHSSLRAAVDVELEVTRVEGTDVRRIRTTKQKDGDDTGEFFFKLTPVDIGRNAQGDEVPAKVVEYCAAPTEMPREAPLPKDEAEAFTMVEELADYDGRTTKDAVRAHVLRGTWEDPAAAWRRIARALGKLQRDHPDRILITDNEVKLWPTQ